MNRTESYTVPIKWITLHIILGLLFAYFKSGVQLWVIGAAIYGIFSIQTSRDKGFAAAQFAAYIVGFEVLLRMAGTVLPYETGKYLTMILLLLGRLFGSPKNTYQWVWAVFILMLPAIMQTFSWSYRPRIDILANMTGMLSLLVAVAYFYERRMDYNSFKRIIGFMVLPLISIGAYLFVVTPDFDKIIYQSVANFETSGGFGPNQVSSVLGFGWLMILFFILCDNGFTKNKLLDYGLFSYLIFRALFTFSRGGNVGAAIAFLAFLFFGRLSGSKRFFSGKSFTGILVAAISVFAIVTFLNNKTNNVFLNRYSGRNTYGEKVEDITSNRSNIIQQELELFGENPLGSGFGGSQYYRKQHFGGETVMSHNEFGRLISENGIFGLIIIVILLRVPIRFYKRARDKSTICWLIAILIYGVSIMMHSAMRIAMPGFLYGLSLVSLYFNETDERI